MFYIVFHVRCNTYKVNFSGRVLTEEFVDKGKLYNFFKALRELLKKIFQPARCRFRSKAATAIQRQPAPCSIETDDDEEEYGDEDIEVDEIPPENGIRWLGDDHDGQSSTPTSTIKSIEAHRLYKIQETQGLRKSIWRILEDIDSRWAGAQPTKKAMNL